MKTKRSLLAAASCIVLGLAGAGSALAEKVTLGVLTDMSGTFSDLSGAGSVEAARLAIEDFGGSVLGETWDGRPVRLGNRRDLMPGGADTFMSYDTPWANASNTPFRLFKHWVHEGGISTPLIVHWPQGFTGGRIVHAPGHVIDIMATCLDAASAPYPESYGDRQITPLEGESLLAACRGEDWSRERPIFWEHEGNRAVRLPEWKAVSRYPGEWELYNMVEDRTETVDLAGVTDALELEPARLAMLGTRAAMTWRNAACATCRSCWRTTSPALTGTG